MYTSTVKKPYKHVDKREENGSLSVRVLIVSLVLIGVLFFFLFPKGDAPFVPDPADVAKETIKRDVYADSLIHPGQIDPNWVLRDTSFSTSQPEINGVAGILVDVDSGEILFDKDSSKQMKIASVVKIMTAVVALEHMDLKDTIRVSNHAANIGENAMGITEGETYTLEELLQGLLLNSGNDSAYAIAEGVAGDVSTFVRWMNLKGMELGLSDSYFMDPSGLDEGTYSSPRDLVVLTKYAMQKPEFREYVSLVSLEIPHSENHKYLYLENQTNLLTTYPGVAGVKTGYTEEAGLCLVTYASNGGHDLIGVVLNSADRKGDMILMLDHGFSSLGVFVEHNLLE